MLRVEDKVVGKKVIAAPGEISLDQIVKQSEMVEMSSDELAAAIMQEFNSNADPHDSAITESVVRGEVIPRGKFLLAHRNEVPELKLYKGTPLARSLYAMPGVYTEILSQPNINDTFYGAHGSYVLNVPVGQYALARSGNLPLIYGTGTHVIHDRNFRFDPATGLVNQNQHFIKHGNYNIVRVPVGAIATIKLNNIPYLLEGRSEPYIYDSPYFDLLKKSDQEFFYSAEERLIQHGPIKRVMPHTGEVAISYDQGKLHIIKPGVTIIDSPRHHVESRFITTARVTQQFPSEETKVARKRENPQATTDEVNYEIFTTKDSLKVGVKIMVAYEIEDPEVAFSKLGSMRGILEHIENCANVDMGKAVQMCSSQEFLASYQNKASKKEDEPEERAAPLKHILDDVRIMLTKDLADVGIHLARFNIESPKILNQTIASEMEKQSILTATANAKQSTLSQQYEIETQQARREAQTKNIILEQQNRAKLATADADLEASKKRAEAIVIEAEAQRKASEMRGTQYQQHPELLQLELAKLQAEMFKSAQIYVTPEQMQAMMQSMTGMQRLPMGYSQQPFAMFGAGAAQQRAANVVQLQQPTDGQEARKTAGM